MVKKHKAKKHPKSTTEEKSFHNEPIILQSQSTIFTQIKQLPTSSKFVFSIVIALLAAFISAYAYINSHEDFAANFADNTLRPLIGNQATIALEALFFNTEDRFNQLKYHMNKSTKTFAASEIHDNIASSSALSNATFPLAPLTPIIKNDPLSGEGVWSPLVSTNGATLMAKTSIRADTERPYAIVDLVKMNMYKLQIQAMAGLAQPGGKANPGPGMIPLQIQMSNSLIAAFNGGFQQKDGYYGMIVGTKTYLPLEQQMATLVISTNKQPIITRYTGQNFGNDVIAIRQNGPMLIENNKIVTDSSEWNMQTWGLTTTNSMYTWRSGLGVTSDGNLIYACGPSLVPQTLAAALKAAGAVNAMQLDINPVWVRFVLFTSLGSGKYTYHALEQNIVNGGYAYLHGYQKDFFYLYKK